MKKSSLSIFILFCFLSVKAQTDYTFSSQSGTYTSLISPTSAILVPAHVGTRTTLDESFANNISLGFAFQYNGINYSNIHLNANGFASLGAVFLASTATNPNYDVNELRGAAGFKGAIRPILAPFWDNLLLQNSSDLSYKTEGNSPNRTFTAQWQNMVWQSGSAAISFQLKIYETTNVIEFIYQQQAAAGGSNKSVSIGITSQNITPPSFEADLGNFISLANTGTSPTNSRILETENISTKPANGQIYRFTPNVCASPSGIKVSELTQNTAAISWTALSGASNYEYAISNLEVTPTTGTVTNLTTINLAGLAPKTDCFFYIRNQCGSSWRLFKFKTPTSATLPYTEGFENTIDNAIPRNMIRENNSNSFADIYWQSTEFATAATGGSKASVNASPFVDAQTWLYTPSVVLEVNKSYKIAFKYATTGGTQGFEVRYGEKIGASTMTNALLARNNISNTAYKDTIITFTPPSTATYYLGFLYKSTVNNHLFLLDDISLSVAVFPCTDNPVLPNYAIGTSTHVKATNTITAANKIATQTNILYQAGKAIIINPGFEIKSGGVFKAQIGGCN